MSQCPVCGSNVNDKDTVCPGCGSDLASIKPPDSNIPSSPEAVLPSGSQSPTPGTFEEAPLPIPVPVSLARLTLKRSGALTNDSFPLGTRVTVGRFDPESGPVDVDLAPLPEAAYVSRHHAEIWRDDAGQWLIKDLDSSNHTFVRVGGQGEFLLVASEQQINDGDEIALGNARFEFRVGG